MEQVLAAKFKVKEGGKPVKTLIYLGKCRYNSVQLQ
jgi:hypothetical protein